MSRLYVDLDGTLVTKRWPELGEWMPGAVEAMKAIHDAGHTITLYSARLATRHPSGKERTPAELVAQINSVRDLLDEAGLSFVDIAIETKPHYHLLVCDRAMRFPGRPGSWAKILPAVLARLEAG